MREEPEERAKNNECAALVYSYTRFESVIIIITRLGIFSFINQSKNGTSWNSITGEQQMEKYHIYYFLLHTCQQTLSLNTIAIFKIYEFLGFHLQTCKLCLPY